MSEIASVVFERRQQASHFAILYIKHVRPDVCDEQAILPLCIDPCVYIGPSSKLESELTSIRNTKDLTEFVSNCMPEDLELWIFLDEAQQTYNNSLVWDTLMTKSPFQHHFVVAAGSYGSHTGSYSHSPPAVVGPVYRMGLFPSEEVRLCIAFTNDDFAAFIALAGSSDDLNGMLPAIKEYASPYPPKESWEGFLHPGVAVQLTQYMISAVRCVSV